MGTPQRPSQRLHGGPSPGARPPAIFPTTMLYLQCGAHTPQASTDTHLHKAAHSLQLAAGSGRAAGHHTAHLLVRKLARRTSSPPLDSHSIPSVEFFPHSAQPHPQHARRLPTRQKFSSFQSQNPPYPPLLEISTLSQNPPNPPLLEISTQCPSPGVPAPYFTCTTWWPPPTTSPPTPHYLTPPFT